jgi:hypothetical protein
MLLATGRLLFLLPIMEGSLRVCHTPIEGCERRGQCSNVPGESERVALLNGRIDNPKGSF